MTTGRVSVERVGNRIHADVPWNLPGSGKVRAKNVPGARAKYEGQQFIAWTYPLTVETCRLLRKEFGKDLRVGSGLASWARNAIAAEEAQLKLRTETDATLRRVPQEAPALAAAMATRTYQRVGAQFINNGRTVLIADDPGLGKTLEALGGLVEAGAKRVLVFAKLKAAELVWGSEVPRWLGDRADVHIAARGSKAQRDKVLDQFNKAAGWSELEAEAGSLKMRILVCNIEMARTKQAGKPCNGCDDGMDMDCEFKARHKRDYDVRFPQLFAAEWDAIIVDESHKALIGKHMISKNVTQTRLGMMKLPLKDRGLKIALSGTPMRGKSQNIWGTLNWLDKEAFSSYWRFVESFFEIESGYAGSRIIKGLDPAKVADYDRTLARYMLRRTKAEVAPDMPPRQYCGTPLDPADPQSTIGVWMEMEPAQAKRYAEIRDSADVDFNAGKLLINGVLPELTRRKQFAICEWDLSYRTGPEGEDIEVLNPIRPSNKYNWLVEFVEERMAAGLKVVVASQFTRVVDAFSAWLKADGIDSYKLTGATNGKRALANVAAFNDPADPVPVFLINTMAGGESINLDACADDIVFLDETFIPDDQEQVENRIHRMSRIHQVNVWYLRSLGTVDESICRITGARDLIVKGRLDGSRGVNTARKLVEEIL